MSEQCRERLFTTSVEVIEFSHLLEQSENTAKWGWLFRTYMQWHAVALILSELCTRPPGPGYERAWRAVESVYDAKVLSNPRNQKGMLWRPMRQLMAKAGARRAQLTADGFGPSGPNNPSKLIPTPTSMSPTSFLNNLTVLGPAASAFGLDTAGLESELDLWNGSAVSQMSMTKAPNPAMAIDGVEPGDADSWMMNGQMQLDPNILLWTGWNPGVGDFTLAGQSPLPDFAANGQQQWS